MCAHMLEKAFGANLALHEPQSIVAFEDHMSYVHRSPAHVSQGLVGGVRGLSAAHRAFAARHHLAQHGYLQRHLDAGDAGNTGSEGISHSIMAEHYALPGQLIAGTDSHTPHSGAVGCVAFGVGTTDMANAFVTGAVRLTMPEVLRVEFEGPLPPGVTAKDLVLHLLATSSIRAGGGVGKVFEFGGSVVRALATDERTTLTNMTAELGGFTGIVEPDAETVRFLEERRGVDAFIEPWMASDAGAPYCDVIRIDCRNLSPMVARPGDPRQRRRASRLARPRKRRHRIWRLVHRRQARGFRPLSRRPVLGGGARLARAGAGEALPAVRIGRRTRLLHAQGYLPAFEAVGAELLQPACGACANCGPARRRTRARSR
jgi:3-isopropylmalate/(R)-2-methylmalate dehydratase large subunit